MAEFRPSDSSKAEGSLVCGICLENIIERTGVASITCGSCGQKLHLRCYWMLHAQSKCPLCRQEVDSCVPQAIEHCRAEDRYREDVYQIRIANGPRQEEVLSVAIDAGARIAILGEEIATRLASDEEGSIYNGLDRDPSRVCLKVDGVKIDCLEVLPKEKRNRVQVEISAEGWRDDIVKLRERGQHDLAQKLEEFGQKLVEDGPDQWNTTYEFGKAVRLNLALTEGEQTRGSAAGEGSAEEILEVLEDVANSTRLTPSEFLKALYDEFGS